MEVLGELGGWTRPSVVTIGAYDGVHRGHQAVIAQVRARAADLGVASVAVTFDRHPASVVRPESAPALLCDLDQKLELLAATGLDACHVIRFDAERATETAVEFVNEVLVDGLATREVVVGADFHFGKGRQGNVALLGEMGPSLGFAVRPIELVSFDDLGPEPVSSTAVRRALAAGDVARAASMLGRFHELRGTVEPGDQRGRELGFPTANVGLPDHLCLPADGIYAGWYLRPDGTRHAAAISLGRRPTFYVDAHRSLLEPHLLDFRGDLYGEAARVQFVERLRGEERYESLDALVAQIRLDCDHARDVLGA